MKTLLRFSAILMGMLISPLLLTTFQAGAQANSLSETLLRSEYQRIREIAVKLAGDPSDIPKRVNELHQIFVDSGGNHVFPQVALHGALWAYGYFEKGGNISQIISYRYFYNKQERLQRLQMLEDFAESFKATNRLVFIDTYTNYYFTKFYGQELNAKKIIPDALLIILNKMHLYRENQQLMPKALRRELFKMALIWEQENSVARSVAEAIKKFNCPILKRLALSPIVRFSYFPSDTFFVFKNFADKQERIDKAMESYEIAERVGWDLVLNSVLDYQVPGVLPQ